MKKKILSLIVILIFSYCFGQSNLLASSKKDTLFLPPPQNLSAVGGNECIHLEWDVPDTARNSENDLHHLGYNIYEQTKGFVTYIESPNNTEFTDDIVAVGVEYMYWVTALYEEGESDPSNSDTAIPYYPSPNGHETFNTDWALTGWTTSGSPNNWLWSPGHASLRWSPIVTDYDMSLISPVIQLPDDPQSIHDMTISMYIDDYTNADTGETMEIWVIHDTGEDMIFQWDLDENDDWGVLGGTDWIYEDMYQYAGQNIQLKFRSHGGSTYHFNYWYIYDILLEYEGITPDYGALEGIVVNMYCEPMEGVRVTADNSKYNPVYTDENGYYTIDPMAAGSYDIQYYKNGYCETWFYDVVIDSGNTTVQNAVIGNWIPPDIYAHLAPGDSSTHTVFVPNYTDETVEWTTSFLPWTKLKNEFLNNDFHKSDTIPLTLDAFADKLTAENSTTPSRETWDILFNYDVDTITGCTGPAGAEFGNDYFLVSEWGYNNGEYRNVYKLDYEGNLIGTWEPTWMPANTGLRDMAFDGEYFYGSNAGTTIYQFDEDGNLHGTITSPVDVRAIAYDSYNDAFWVNNFNDDLKLIDRSGNVLNTISSPPSMYGCAYDNVSNSGPYLWIFTGTSSAVNVCQIEQYDLNTLSLTGITHSVSDDFGAGIAGGLFTYKDDISETFIIGGLKQGSPNVLLGYDLGHYNPWITINPSSGVLKPLSGEYVNVNLYANNDPAGTHRTCMISFESIQTGDPIYGVFVSLTIIDTVSTNVTPHEETTLRNNFPNPVFNNTTFEFSLKEPSHVTLSLYNLKGQLVTTLLDDELEPSASHCIEWDGNAYGKRLANGIYFYKLETGKKSFLKKMVLMR